MKRIENASIVSDDDKVQYISTQLILGRSMGPMLPSDDDNDVMLSSEASSDSLEDIDDVLVKHSQKALFQAAPPSSLYSLSQNCARQSNSSYFLCNNAKVSRCDEEIKGSVGVGISGKSREIKQIRTKARKETTMRKMAKIMKPRKDDVSQLIDEFLELKSSQ